MALEPGPKGDVALPAVSTIISPILDLNDILSDLVLTNVTGLDLSGGSGLFVSAVVVPDDHKWELQFAVIDSSAAATTLIIRSPEAIDLLIQLTSTGPSYISTAIRGITLGAGWGLGLRETGNGGDSSRSCRFLYLDEVLPS
ncbi:MAG TPA: hypothetical protein EYO33_11955 [Phycisphaerales bacterium]|nr:hypothetical protein [Phycisphaerales bacterium]